MSLGQTLWPSITDQLPMGLLVLDGNGVILEWNLWLVERTQIDRSVAVGRTLKLLFEGFEDPPFEKAFRAVLATGVPHTLSRTLDHYLIPITVHARRGARGILMEQRVELAPVTSAAGDPAVAVLIIDVTVTARRTERLFRLARSMRRRSNTDALTGLYNRRFMADWMDQAMKFSLRNRSPLSLVMFDIDLFKRINDTHGHVVGDAVIRDLGVVIKTQVRSSDVVVRYGGEEFALLMPNCDLANAIVRARDVVQAIGEASVGQLKAGSVTCSAGVAVFDPASPVGARELTRRADLQLYEAKHLGGNVAMPRSARAGEAA